MKTNTARMEKKTGINAETASLEDSTMLATSTIGGFNMQSQNGYQKELFGKSYSYAKHIADEPRTNSSIPPDKSVKIASNNIVAQGTAQQMQSTVNNTTNNTVGAGMIRAKSSDQSKKDSSYSAFEIEFNSLVRKHFPHWECKEIF